MVRDCKMKKNSRMKEWLPGFWLHYDQGNAGVFVNGTSALLINPMNQNLADDLIQFGIQSVDQILFTHHRRELADGLGNLKKSFSVKVYAPKNECELFTCPDKYWGAPLNRWEVLMDRSRHIPYHATHIHQIEIAKGLKEGDEFHWNDWLISVLETPGYTDGALSYMFQRADVKIIFSGDLIYSSGCIRDLYSLQHCDKKNGVELRDYHGFMGSSEQLYQSLKKIKNESPDFVVPAHGEVMYNFEEASALLEKRLKKYYHMYQEVSALRWYFPEYFKDFTADEDTLEQQETFDLPKEVSQLLGTCWLLKSNSKRAILIDPYSKACIQAVQELIDAGEIEAIDLIWITHYHWDHKDVVKEAAEIFACPISTDKTLADEVENPLAYYLPCQRDNGAKVDFKREHGESWDWQEFKLTSYFFPGQTFLHAGFLVETKQNKKYFFTGDSFTPAGIDDYCSWNRNFLGEKNGFRDCIQLLKELKPDALFNQHVSHSFKFSDKAYDHLLLNLEKREKYLQDLLPWPHPDFGLDESWVRAYPYEQKVSPGTKVSLELVVTNHSLQSEKIKGRVCLPKEWGSDIENEGIVKSQCDSGLKFEFKIPDHIEASRVILPIEVEFSGKKLGAFREAILQIREE